MEHDQISALAHVYARDNVIAVASDKTVWLWVSDETPAKCEGPNKSSILVDIALSNDAIFLFSWWSNDASSSLQIWDISRKNRPSLVAEATFEGKAGRPETRFVVPCGNLPACITTAVEWRQRQRSHMSTLNPVE